jgi:hypothetical protein
VKGFPNQVTDLQKLAKAMETLVELVDAGKDAKSYTEYGIALVRAGVLNTGHGRAKKPVDQYIAEQLSKKPNRQSIQTTPRGLRELFRWMRLIDDSGATMVVTELGRRAGSFAEKPWDQTQIEFWRGVVRDIEHTDDHGTSHPYQVQLRLIAQKPGIARAKCALAFEARDDSRAELDRIAALAALSENDIRSRLGVKKSNWENAKKVLPRFAEQLGDVIRSKDGTYVLADAPGRADAGPAKSVSKIPKRARRPKVAPSAPRTSREVTPETIGMAGIAERFGDVPPPPSADPAAIAAANKSRADRLRRHNTVVREFSTLFAKAGAKLHEDPFDILALFDAVGILVEVKTLDGSPADERDRVREAFSQLLYYEVFLPEAVAGEVPVGKIGCFEEKISEDHAKWLNKYEIGVVWKAGGKFVGDDLAREFLGGLLKEFE